MSEQVDAEELQELVAGYVLGNLTSEESEQLQRLLQTHPELLREVNQLQEVLASIPYGLPKTTPPEELRSTILQAVSSTPPVVPLQKVKQSRLQNRIWQGLGGIAAIAAIAFGIQNLQLRHELVEAQHEAEEYEDLFKFVQQPASQLVALKGKTDTVGNAVVLPGQTDVMIVLQNLPVLSDGQSYQLWTLVGGKPTPAGQFQAEEDRTACVKLPISTAQPFQGFAISIETTPNPSQPSAEIVLTSQT